MSNCSCGTNHRSAKQLEICRKKNARRVARPRTPQVRNLQALIAASDAERDEVLENMFKKPLISRH